METSGSPSPAPSPLLLLSVHGELYRAWGVFSKPSQKDRLRREKGHAERRSSSLGVPSPDEGGLAGYTASIVSRVVEKLAGLVTVVTCCWGAASVERSRAADN